MNADECVRMWLKCSEEFKFIHETRLEPGESPVKKLNKNMTCLPCIHSRKGLDEQLKLDKQQTVPHSYRTKTDRKEAMDSRRPHTQERASSRARSNADSEFRGESDSESLISHKHVDNSELRSGC